jgi:uncharacterized membrane protein
MKIDEESLKEKGWTRAEIKDTERILSKGNESSRKTQIMLYWFIVFAMVILTLLISLWLIPFFMVLEGVLVFIILFLLGISFGAMFNNLIIHLEHLERKHYIIAGLIIPFVAIASLFIIIKAATYTSAILNIPVRQDPIEDSLFYVAGFLLPYIYGLLYRKERR